MVKFVTYEVYAMKPAGKWSLRSRFDDHEKQEAFSLSKSIETTERIPTKIIKETYDSENNTNQNAVAYISPKIRQMQPKKRGYAGSRYKGEIPSLVINNANEEKTSFSKIVWLFVFVLLVSFILAALTSFITVFILSKYSNISNDVGSQIVLAIFIVMFILTALPMSRKFIPWHKLNRMAEEKVYDPYDDVEVERFSLGEKLQNIISDFLIVKEEPESEKKPDTIPEKKETKNKEESVVEKEFKNIFDMPDAKIFEEDLEIEEMKQEKTEDVNDLLAPKNNMDEGNEAEDDAPPAPKKIDKVYENYKKQIMYFVKEVALILKSESLPITAFTKFGLNLLIVGAIDNIKDKGGISDDGAKELLSDSLLLLGIQPHLAEMFYDKIESYTLNPLYLQMMQNGKAIMIAMAGHSSDTQEIIASSFKDWLKPVSKEHDIITVMFTDITDSTAITDALGDEKGYQLVKAHNKIVRKALREMNGREIKHTGDGIMASFLSAASAVQGAILIQRLVISYNNKNSELPLSLRIGLSSGEPVREGQDLFGATVQIASRLCDYATSGQILASREVKDLNPTLSDNFIKIGDEELKGIKTPVEIYDIKYTQEAVSDAPEAKEE